MLKNNWNTRVKIEDTQLQKKHEGNSLKATSTSFCGHSLNHSHLKELSKFFSQKTGFLYWVQSYSAMNSTRAT